jgi:hypothetical protein
MAERLIHEIKRKYPGLGKKCKTSKAAAIRLFCIECMGGSVYEVSSCTARECTLWHHRLSASTLPKDPEHGQEHRDTAPRIDFGGQGGT